MMQSPARQRHVIHRSLACRCVRNIVLVLALLSGVRNATAAPREIKLLALGDSLVAGYGLAHEDGFVSKLQKALDAHNAGIKVIDAGVSGDTSTDALARLDWALGDKPDVVFIELGGNDGLRGLDPKTMGENLQTIITDCQKIGLPVLVSGMLAPPNMGADYASKYKESFDKISHIPGILWDPFFLEGVAGNPALEQQDHIHPNAAGVDVIVSRILPQILKLGSLSHKLSTQ